ncbi:MAG: hypothetical protein HRT43_13660 [Campylobacteraceae bacterium]|nr:hypothetical protein [Campylobacteraceae bacterium]
MTNTNESYFTINLMTFATNNKAQKFLESNKVLDDAFIYKFGDNLNYVKVINGIYESYEKANLALNKIDKELDSELFIIDTVKKHKELFLKYNVGYEIPQKENKKIIKRKISKKKTENYIEELESIINNQDAKSRFLNAKKTDYMINLTTFNSLEALYSFVEENNLFENVFAFRFEENKKLIKLVYGVYATENEAKLDLEKISNIKNINPIIQNALDVQKLYGLDNLDRVEQNSEENIESIEELNVLEESTNETKIDTLDDVEEIVEETTALVMLESDDAEVSIDKETTQLDNKLINQNESEIAIPETIPELEEETLDIVELELETTDEASSEDELSNEDNVDLQIKEIQNQEEFDEEIISDEIQVDESEIDEPSEIITSDDATEEATLTSDSLYVVTESIRKDEVKAEIVLQVVNDDEIIIDDVFESPLEIKIEKTKTKTKIIQNTVIETSSSTPVTQDKSISNNKQNIKFLNSNTKDEGSLEKEFMKEDSSKYTIMILNFETIKKADIYSLRYGLESNSVIFTYENQVKLIHGVYDTFKEAVAASKVLHPFVLTTTPYVRKIRGYQKLYNKYNTTIVSQELDVKDTSVELGQIKQDENTKFQTIQFNNTDLKTKFLNSDSEQYTISLATLNNFEDAQLFRIKHQIEDNSIAYKFKDSVRLIYGIFNSALETRMAMENLNKSLKRNKPFINKLDTHLKLYKKYNKNSGE